MNGILLMFFSLEDGSSESFTAVTVTSQDVSTATIISEGNMITPSTSVIVTESMLYIIIYTG